MNWLRFLLIVFFAELQSFCVQAKVVDVNSEIKEEEELLEHEPQLNLERNEVTNLEALLFELRNQVSLT